MSEGLAKLDLPVEIAGVTPCCPACRTELEYAVYGVEETRIPVSVVWRCPNGCAPAAVTASGVYPPGGILPRGIHATHQLLHGGTITTYQFRVKQWPDPTLPTALPTSLWTRLEGPCDDKEDL